MAGPDPACRMCGDSNSAPKSAVGPTDPSDESLGYFPLSLRDRCQHAKHPRPQARGGMDFRSHHIMCETRSRKRHWQEICGDLE